MTAGAEVGGTVIFRRLSLSLAGSLARSRALGRDDVMAHSSGQVVTFDAA